MEHAWKIVILNFDDWNVIVGIQPIEKLPTYTYAYICVKFQSQTSWNVRMFFKKSWAAQQCF